MWVEPSGPKCKLFSLRDLTQRMITTTVFFSWQSDRPTREGRNLIEKALATAMQRISHDLEMDEPPRDHLLLDKDTLDVPGSPPVFDTIRQKIERAAIFVPDLTFVSKRPNGDPAPNPNVLIEYGYALKCLGHHRIVGVMNKSYGEPSRSLPFDLAHHRFPITYDLADGASEEVRKGERERLAKTLEAAIRGVLDSEEYSSSLPKPPAPPPVTYREPRQGRARFRQPGEPIGYSNDSFSSMIGKADWPVALADGPAIWLRVMPQQPLDTRLKISALRGAVMALGVLPLFSAYSNIFSVRGSDGIGLCTHLSNQNFPSLVFVFTDAEIWTIDTYPLSAEPRLIALEESKFAESLKQCAEFLNDRLNIPGPYRWITGIEGVNGRFLPLPNDRLGRARGPCTVDLIEEEGVFSLGQNPAMILEPFFEKVFEFCGIARPRAASNNER
jgi:hypothetical protein